VRVQKRRRHPYFEQAWRVRELTVASDHRSRLSGELLSRCPRRSHQARRGLVSACGNQRASAPGRCGLRSELALADQPAEQVTAADVIEIDHLNHRALVAGRRFAERRPLRECAVWPVLVVMGDVGREGVLEVAAAEDQQAVEAFAADAADPALGVRSRLGARTGALITRMPSERKTSSKSRVNLLSRSRTRNRTRTENAPPPPLTLPIN
jgi:hypothetical protein